VLVHQIPDRSRRDHVAELDQLASNSHIAAAGILPRQSEDELPALPIDPRATRTTPAPERGHFLRTRARCQPNTVSGRTSNPPNARRGNRLARAARIIRSAEFNLGFLTVRRRTLSSWRRRRSSISRSRSPSSLSTTRPTTKRRQP
jgi:hypothetical protein